MSWENEKYAQLRVSFDKEKLKEVRKYLSKSGANISEFVNMLIGKGIETPENDERLCYECGRVTPEFKNKVRKKIENKFKNLNRFSKVLGIDRAYVYLVFNNRRKGSPELWKRIFLAIKD